MKTNWTFPLVLLLLTATAGAQVQLIYTIAGGSVTITGHSGFGPLETLAIPAMLDNLPVTGIGAFALYDLPSATNVLIPASIASIGVGAFAGCGNLTALIVDPQNPSFSSTNGVLFDKDQTTLVDYPGGLAGSYTIPGSVTNLASGAFELCAGLTGVTIPNSVATIGDEVFDDCTGLTNVTIPGSVISVGEATFFACVNLAEITVDATNPSYSSVAGVLFDRTQATLIECPGGLAGSYVIPGTVTSVGPNAFNECVAITNVTMPASVTNVGDGTFFGCSQLRAITVAATNSLYSSGGGALFNKTKSILIQYPGGLAGSYTIPASVKAIGADAFESCQSLTTVTIHGTVTNIGIGAFENCLGLTKVTMSSGVIGVKSNAFENCLNLANVTLPGTVKSIGTGAFKNCSFMETVTLDAGVANIESNAFEDCYSLSSVTIPTSVTNIGDAAFDYCLSLSGITIPDKVARIGALAFAFCSGLTHITIPVSVTNVGEEAFGYCSSLSGVTMPNTLWSIAPYTFYECADLRSVTIPSGVRSIETGAFEQCYSLASVTIPASVTSIADEAFGDCTSLTSITIPASVTNISGTAFNDSSSLMAITVDAQNPSYSSINGVLFNKDQTTLVEVPGGLFGSYAIPGSVTQIGDFALENCHGLTNVIIPSSVTNIGASSFENCDGLISITIPASVTGIGANAFIGTEMLDFYFNGNAPAVDAPAVDPVDNPTVYYLPDTTGWTEFSAVTGLSPALWNPMIQTASGFGVQDNQFGFTITGATNLVVVVEACTNLASPAWTPVQNVALTNGSFNFSEPFQSNMPARFYGLAFP